MDPNPPACAPAKGAEGVLGGDAVVVVAVLAAFPSAKRFISVTAVTPFADCVCSSSSSSSTTTSKGEEYESKRKIRRKRRQKTQNKNEKEKERKRKRKRNPSWFFGCGLSVLLLLRTGREAEMWDQGIINRCREFARRKTRRG